MLFRSFCTLRQNSFLMLFLGVDISFFPITWLNKNKVHVPLSSTVPKCFYVK